MNVQPRDRFLEKATTDAAHALNELMCAEATVTRLEENYEKAKAKLHQRSAMCDEFLKTVKLCAKMPPKNSKCLIASGSDEMAVSATVIDPDYGYSVRFRLTQAGPVVTVNGNESSIKMYVPGDVLEFRCTNHYRIDANVDSEVSIGVGTITAAAAALTAAGVDPADGNLTLRKFSTGDYADVAFWSGKLHFPYAMPSTSLSWLPFRGVVIAVQPCCTAHIESGTKTVLGIITLDEMWERV